MAGKKLTNSWQAHAQWRSRNNCGANFGSSSRTPVTNCLLRTECKLREVRRLKSENQNTNDSASCFWILHYLWLPLGSGNQTCEKEEGRRDWDWWKSSLKDQSGAKEGRARAKQADYQKNLIYQSNMEAQVPETCDNLLRFFCRRSSLNTRKQTNKSLSIYQHRPSILILTCW